jgi:excinuclease UvrABC nuclease subunit
LPSSPGVYWFLNAQKQLLYIGKAKNLKRRLKWYDHPIFTSPRLHQLVKQTVNTRFQPTYSEIAALLLEAKLIQLHQPPFNIRLKDNKSNLYILITKELFPRVLTVRKTDSLILEHQYLRLYGPFISGRQTRQLLREARRIFPFCNASATDRKKHRACFFYHLHQCPGVCVGDISAPDYLFIIHQLADFLAGKHRHLYLQMLKNLKSASKTENYEAAIKYKQQLDLLMICQSSLSSSIGYDTLELTGNSSIDRLSALKQVLTTSTTISLTNSLHRIEAFDIANIQGKDATASMVVCDHGDPDHSAYRHFKIKLQTTPNDVLMMKQTLNRRQRHPEWGIPDLILVDGGLPQVNGVVSILKWNIPCIGIAKNPDRLIIPAAFSRTHRSIAIRLPIDHPALTLVQSLRDEAHRFSRRLHHHLQNQTFFG